MTLSKGFYLQIPPAVVVIIKLCNFLFLARFRKHIVCSPLLVNFSVYSGHHAGDFRELAPLASTLVERWYIAPGVQRVDVREKGVRATLFIPPGIFANTDFPSSQPLERI